VSLRFAHELGFGIALGLGLLSVLLGGQLPPATWLALAVPLLSGWMKLSGHAVSTAVGSVVALAGFVWAALLWIDKGMDASLLAASVALVSILTARLITRRTPNHDLHGLVLSLLLVFAGTVLHQQFTYGLVFVTYAVAVTWALVTRQLIAGAEIESYRTGGQAALHASLARRDVVTPTFFAVTAGVAVVILLSTSLLFVLFPRIGLGGLGLRGRSGLRLPGDVSLFGPPRALTGGSQLVARVFGVSYQDFVHGLYLRGGVYDRLDSAGFAQSGTLLGLRPSELRLVEPVRRTEYEVFLEPVTDQVLLTLGPVQRAQDARVLGGGFANPSARARIVGLGPTGELLTENPLTGPLRYRVRGGVATPHVLAATEPKREAEPVGFIDPAFSAHFLALPPRLDPRIPALARQVAGDAPTFAARAAALRRYLLSHFTYTLDQPNAGRSDPLAAFLFEDRRGHCEYFATAFAVLLRAAGVPSRVVGGYQGGVWDEAGPVVVFTGQNAHAWVEWYVPGKGWVLDDATPAADAATLAGLSAWMERMRRLWDDEIVEFGLDQQLELLNGLVSTFHTPSVPTEHVPWRPVVAAVLLACLALGVGWAARRAKRRRERGRPPRLATALQAAVERLEGKPVPAHWTLREAVQAASRRAPPEVRAVLAEALEGYEVARFAVADLAAARERHLRRALGRVRRSLAS
jgi:transglutaminase-like putative cysteine protease